MKMSYLKWAVFLLLAAGCASTKPKAVIWESKEIPRPYDIVGPVSVSEQITESTEETIQGLAGYISKDGRISGQVPSDIQAALDAKRVKYKEMIFDKLAEKTKEYDADAVIGAEYMYVPPYATFSTKASVTAKGTMVKYK